MRVDSTQPRLISSVYYANSKDCTVNPIAIRPNLTKEKITWEDTSRGFSARLATLVTNSEEGQEPDVIEVTTQDKKNIRLVKLTLDIYNTHVKGRVAGHPKFDSDQEIQNYYLNTSFE